MSAGAEGAHKDLAAFLEKRTAEGLFLRYCRGRIRHLPMRIALVVFCLPLVFTVMDGSTTLAIAATVLVADFFDAIVLSVILRWGKPGRRMSARLVVTGVSAAVQALTVATFILMLVHHAGEEARPFAIAVALANLMDAGLHFRYHRGASVVRMLIYLAAIVLIFLAPSVAPDASANPILMDFGAALLLGHIVLVFVRYVHSTTRRSEAKQQDFLHTALQLERSNGALRESRQTTRRLAMIAEQVDDSIVVTGPDDRITWVNPAFTRLTGYAFDEAVGLPVTTLNSPDADPEAVRRLAAARRDRSSVRTEILSKRKNGENFWVEASLTPMFDDAGELSSVIGVDRDIGKLKAREQALADARIAAESAMRAKNTFLATMSHEIRTPMNGVIGTAELLLDTPLSAEQKTLVETISSCGDALLAIVDDVLDFSRLEAGRLELRPAPFCLRTCVEGVTSLLRPLAEAKGLALRLECKPPAPPPLLGDSGRLRQILLNLVGNAIKFTGSGAVTVAISTTVTEGSASVRIDVRDTGIGIPADALERIFESFTQADSTVAGRFGGTGLGLSISRLLADQMGGHLGAHSEPDRGSTFSLTLTLPVTETALPSDRRRDEGARRPLAGCHALIADDNRTNILLLTKMLEPLGVELDIAADGKAAVSKFLSRRPDIVLMDMNMPVMSGIEATQEIRRQERLKNADPCPIIALTASAFAEDRERCRIAGMDGFLSKPFRKADLVGAIRRHLADSLDEAPGTPATAAALPVARIGGLRG